MTYSSIVPLHFDFFNALLTFQTKREYADSGTLCVKKEILWQITMLQLQTELVHKQ